jgi:hypothetical protein
MSFMVAPPSHRQDRSPEGDDVEQLLRAFYRAEMPDPWPSFEAPAEPPLVLPFPAAPARRPLFTRSRLALAASVALLLGGVWSLSGKFGSSPSEPSGPTFMDSSATHRRPGESAPARYKGPFIDVKPNDASELKIIIEPTPPGPGR